MNIFLLVYTSFTYINPSENKPYYDQALGEWRNVSDDLVDIPIKSVIYNTAERHDTYKLII